MDAGLPTTVNTGLPPTKFGIFGFLPKDAVLKIISYLDFYKLGHFSQLSTTFQTLSEEFQTPFWQEFCKKCKLTYKTNFKLNFFVALGQEQPLALLEWSLFWSDGKHQRVNLEKSFCCLSRITHDYGNKDHLTPPRTPEVSRALLYQAMLRLRWGQINDLIPIKDRDAVERLRSVVEANVTYPEDKCRAVLCQASFRFEDRTRCINDKAAFKRLVSVATSPLYGLKEERILAVRLQAEMRLNNRTSAITQEEACKLLIQVASDPLADHAERSHAVIFLAKFLLNKRIFFNIDDQVCQLLNQVPFHFPLSEPDEMLHNTALLLLARMRYTNRTKLIDDEQAVKKLKQATQIEDRGGSEEVLSDKDWAEATFYKALFLLDDRTHAISYKEVFEKLVRVARTDAFNAEDHIKAEITCESMILQARMRISKPKDAISNEEAFKLLLAVAADPKARQDQKIRATLYQVIMQCKGLINSMSLKDAYQKLKSVIVAENASPEDRELAEKYFDILLKSRVKRRK